MKQMNWEESEGCNRFIKNITAGILEYVLEVGIDEAVKEIPAGTFLTSGRA